MTIRLRRSLAHLLSRDGEAASQPSASRAAIMVALTFMAVAAAAIGALAAPAADSYGPSQRPNHVVRGDLPDFEIGPHNLARRQDYNQNYKTGGSVNFSPNSNGYSVTFSGAGDFVVGKGWKKGTDR